MRKINEMARLLLIQTAFFLFFLLLLVAGIELRHWYRYTIKLPPNEFHGEVHTGRRYTWGHPVRSNKWGFRERDFNILTLHQENQFVVLVLGDSFTFGIGLSEAQRYSNLLEKYLQTEYPDRKIVVLNFGIPGRSTTMERDSLRAFYKAVKPDLIIVGFCFNDPLEEMRRPRRRRILPQRIKSVLSFLQCCQLRGTAEIFSTVYENTLIFLRKMESWEVTQFKAYDKNSTAWEDFEKALADIGGMSREVTPSPPIFIALNEGISKRDPTDYNHPAPILQLRLQLHHQAEAAALQAGFITANCEEEMKKFKNYVMAVVPGEDVHPTAAMNEVYARKLFSLIKEHKFVE